MKTTEELNAIKEEVKTMNKKLAELSEEELLQVTGGIAKGPESYGMTDTSSSIVHRKTFG